MTSVQMATLDTARALLDELRSASYQAAVKDHEELKKFVAEQVCVRAHHMDPSKAYRHSLASCNWCPTKLWLIWSLATASVTYM